MNPDPTRDVSRAIEILANVADRLRRDDPDSHVTKTAAIARVAVESLHRELLHQDETTP